MSPDKRPPGPATPEEQHLGVKQEQKARGGCRHLVTGERGLAWRGLPLRPGASTLGETRVGGAPPPPPRKASPGGRPPVAGCPYGSPLAPPLPRPFPSPRSFPHSLRRGGLPEGLSRAAAWHAGQPCDPRPDDPGPPRGDVHRRPGASATPRAEEGLIARWAPAVALGLSRSQGDAKLPLSAPALPMLAPRRKCPGGCLSGSNCTAVWRAGRHRGPPH